jgi:hypothetical protein
MTHHILCGGEALKALNLNEVERVNYLIDIKQAQIVEFSFIQFESTQTDYLNTFLQKLNEFDEFYLLTDSDYFQLKDL